MFAHTPDLSEPVLSGKKNVDKLRKFPHTIQYIITLVVDSI
jgi:hypothetical protein